MPRAHQLQVKARWGLPLEHYLFTFTQTPPDANYSIQEGQKAITRICLLVDKPQNLKRKESAIANSITLSDLHDVMKLAESPPHFQCFLRPSLIPACIKLLAISTQSGLPSLLSHEYGFLTFQILKISLGVCIIDRTYGLGDIIKSLTSVTDSKPDCSHELSIHLSQSLDTHIKDDTCDQMLGWVETKARPAITPLILPPEVAEMLHLLCEDQKRFLKVFIHLPPFYVQGVLFLFWRYTMTQSSLEDHSSDSGTGLLYEVLWRYFLVAPIDQISVQIAAYHDIKGILGFWSSSTKDHSLEDSRVLIQAFIRRFGPSNLSSMDIKTFINLQILVLPFLKPGCEDLVPLIFETFVHQCWNALRYSHWNEGKAGFISDIATVFEHLSELLENLHATARQSRALPGVLTGIVNVMIRNDLLDFIQAMLFLLDPPLGKFLSIPNSTPSSRLLKAVTAFSIRLSRMIPKRTMVEAFENYTRNYYWFKSHHHMICFGDPSITDLNVCYAHNEEIDKFWFGIMVTFCQYHNNTLTTRCNYQRCEAPGRRREIDPRFSCSRCSEIAYCSHKCQVVDWSFDFGIGSHRQLCRGYVKQITADEERMYQILDGEEFKNLDRNYVQPVFDKHDGDLHKIIPELKQLAKLPRHVSV